MNNFFEKLKIKISSMLSIINYGFENTETLVMVVFVQYPCTIILKALNMSQNNNKTCSRFTWNIMNTQKYDFSSLQRYIKRMSTTLLCICNHCFICTIYNSFFRLTLFFLPPCREYFSISLIISELC